MQQEKIYTTKFFKGEARSQLTKDLKKMTKDGWRLKNVRDTGVGVGQDHTGSLTVMYEK
jgi:hypothetical protein